MKVGKAHLTFATGFVSGNEKTSMVLQEDPHPFLYRCDLDFAHKPIGSIRSGLGREFQRLGCVIRGFGGGSK